MNSVRITRFMEGGWAPTLIGLLITVLFGSGCEGSQPRMLNSIDDARKLAVGTWIFSKPGDTWIKLVISQDGRFTEYDAQPIDEDWGKPDAQGTWDVSTGKYPNTGQRYYVIKFSTQAFSVAGMFDGAVFRTVDEIELFGEGRGYTLLRGDRNPFSR